MSAQRFAIRVYYEDTDFSGYVYHAAYLKFMERGRTEFLRSAGVHHRELMKEGMAFAVRAMTLDFLRAAHIDDELQVETAVAEGTGARLVLDQTISRLGEVLVSARVVVVAIRNGRATRLPAVLAALASAELVC